MDQKARRLARATRVTWVGIVLNLLLVAAKLAAGIFGRSRAMVADAVESLTDIPSSLVVIFGLQMGGKPPDKTHDYGHGKIETLASLVVGLFLAGAGVWILVGAVLAIRRSIGGEVIPRPAMVAIVVSVVTVISKEWLFRLTLRVGREENSPATVANAWHHRSDAITTLGTLTGVSGAIFLGPRWRFLDPLTAGCTSVWILWMSWVISRDALAELLEASESDETEERIMTVVRGVPGVNNPHRLRTRRIGGASAVDIHVEVDRALTVDQAHLVADAVEERLRTCLGPETMITVHVEPLGYRERGSAAERVVEAEESRGRPRGPGTGNAREA